jgi:adenylosuccinate synthase
LPREGSQREWRFASKDLTNQPNPWQGHLRFAPHGSAEEFVSAVRDDLKGVGKTGTVSLLLTHLNETQGMVCTAEGPVAPVQWMAQQTLRETFHRLHVSHSPYAEEII